MQMNRTIKFVTANDDTFKSFTTTFMSEGQFQRKMFREFLLGNAGYICESLTEFLKLFITLRHTNICMFNANYEFPNMVPKFTSKGISEFRSKLPSVFYEIKDFTMGEDRWKGILFWLLPQDVDGSYDVSPAFIESVGEILGCDALRSIKRMECIPVSSYNNSSLLNTNKIPWANRCTAGECLVNGEYYLMTLKDPSDDSVSMVGRPILNSSKTDNTDSQIFYIVRPDFDRIGSIYLADMIETQLKHRKAMNQRIKELMMFVLDTIPDVRLGTPGNDKKPDADTLMKAQAVIAWLLSPRSNNIHLYFKNGADTLKKLTSIAMFCNIMIPPINAACVGVFMDMQGMIQIEEKRGDIPSGYQAIDDCDEAISLIYEVIDTTIVNPVAGYFNFASACHYPYFDNVPSIFWNGNLF